MAKQNKILSLAPEGSCEVDGVVFDKAAYQRHCAHQPEAEAPKVQNPPEPAPPAPVFAAEPVHHGWYAAREDRPPVPQMAGAMRPQQPYTGKAAVPQVFCEVRPEQHCGVVQGQHLHIVQGILGSGSYATSFLTSFSTSFLTSYQGSYTSFAGSGSFFGQFRCGSAVFAVCGYGLELI